MFRAFYICAAIWSNVLIFNIKADSTVKFLLLTDSYQVNLPVEFTAGSNDAVDDNTIPKSKIQVVSFNANSNNSNVEDEAYANVCREFSAGVTLVIDTIAAGWPRVRLLADALGVPYVRAEASIAPFARAATSYALRLNASDAALIFQNEAEMEQALSALMSTTRLRITVHKRLPPETTEMLRNTRPWPDMFILFADSINMGPLIKAAVGGGLVTQDQQWLLVLLNFAKQNTSNAEWATDLPKAVAELRPSVPEMCCPLTNNATGCDCASDTEVVSNFVARLMALLTDAVLNGGSVTNGSRQLDCLGITGDDEASISARRDRFDRLLVQVLPRHPSLVYDAPKRLLGFRAAMDVSVIRAGNAGRTGLASWSPDRGLVVTAGRQVAGARSFMRIGMIEMEPWSKYETTGGVWSGYCVDFLMKLAEMMDFEYDILKPNASGLGERNPIDGTWTGLIGQLRNREVELIVAPMTMTSEREEAIDFVVPYFDQTGISIVIRQPVQTTSLFKFMTVLNTEVWLSVLGALITTGLMIWLIDYFSPYSFKNDPARYPYPCRSFTLKESFWFALTSFTPQGGGEVPKSVSARALVAAYWLFVVLMLATFTANLAAFLTVERLQVPVQSLEQLARQSRVAYAVHNNSPTHIYFRNMRNAEATMYRAWMQSTMSPVTVVANLETPDGRVEDAQARFRVWNYPIREQYNIINDNLRYVSTPQEGIEKVLASEDGSFAFIHDSAWLKYEVSRSCLLAEVGEVFAEQPYAIAVYQGHPLTQEFSRKILTLQRDRFFEELAARYWNQSIRTNCPFINDGEGISLESIGGVFIATLFGLMLAVVTLAGEILYHQHVIKKRKGKPAEKTPPTPPDPKHQSTAQYTMPVPHPIIRKRPTVAFNDDKRNKLDNTAETKTGLPKVSYITVYPKQ